MLEAEELARAAEARLHLVDDQQGPVLPAQLLSFLPVLGWRHVNALALDGLDDESGDVPPLQLSAQGLDVGEGDGLAARQEFAETLAELGAPVEGQGAGGEPMEGVLGKEDPGPAGGLPGELDGRFDRLGPGVAKKDPVDVARAPPYELLGQEPGQQGAVHLDHVREVKVDRLVQCRLEGGVAATEGVDAETGQEVEVPVTFGVEEVATFSAHVETVEAYGFERPDQLRVQVLVVESEVLTMTRTQQLGHIERHTSPYRLDGRHITRWVRGVPAHGPLVARRTSF